jgi:CDP-diacylglycerol--serine O-phosphatidyltransferase
MKMDRKWVPSAFTLGNIFCGYFSVISSTNGKFVQAAWLIVAAAVLDALDGKIARFAKVDSRFGVEYDSLADVISFGMGPSMLIYNAVFVNWGNVGLIISIGPLVFASIRLARFNVRLTGFQKDAFEGLPAPSAAVTVSTFVVFNYHIWGDLRWEKVFLFIVIAVCLLMVTSIRYETMPSFNLGEGAANRKKFLFFIFGTIMVAIFPQEAFFPLAAGFVLSGPVYLTWQIFRGENEKNKKNKDKN